MRKLSLLAALMFAALPFVLSQNINLQLRSTLNFPGQKLANICGYWQNGREYALVGANKGLIIVDVTDPTSPQQIVQLPEVQNDWKEIKVYGTYAYVTTEGQGDGLHVVNLSGLPSPNVPNYFYKGDGAIAGQLDRIHALHIDVTKGFLYAYGANIQGGGALIFDLKANPYAPKYVGKFNELGYIHDGYVDNDTLYACHINSGIMSVVDMADKQNPVVLGTVQTPGKFTHNSWMTSDRKHVLTTDEAVPSFLTAYDVSDPNNMEELDRISTNNGYGSYVHNTHILNDYAITSWYTDGVAIVDAHRPQNLVIVAQYDTWNGTGAEFNGCWGAFPYFPSGTIVTSDISSGNVPGKLTVLTPTYKRACYLEGVITNGCTGGPVLGASVVINSSDPQKQIKTKANGVYRTGQVTPGNFTVTFSAPGFPSKTFPVTLAPGEVTTLNVTLEIGPHFTATGVVKDASTGAPLANIEVLLESSTNSYTVTTNGLGQFSLSCMPVGDYTASAGKWGYITKSVPVIQGGQTNLELEPGYYDDGQTDLGWTVSGTASAGKWERGVPEGTWYGTWVNPNTDAPGDQNDICYMTGNGGGSAGTDDVDDGFTSLVSPVMKLANYNTAIFECMLWFYNGGGNSAPNDRLKVNLLKGNQTFHLFDITSNTNGWVKSPVVNLESITPLSDDMRIEFIAYDDNPGHLVEAGMDIFRVYSGTVPTESPLEGQVKLFASPNPSNGLFNIGFAWENADAAPLLEVRNALGQLVHLEQMPAKSGSALLGESWAPGIYFVRLSAQGRASSVLKLVKQ